MAEDRSLETERPRLGAADAVVLFVVALALLLSVSGVVGVLVNRTATALGLSAYGRSIFQPLGVLVTEIFAIFLPAFYWSQARRRHAAVALGLSLPRPLRVRLPMVVLGGVCLGAAWFFVVAMFLEPLIERVLPVPPSERQQLLQLLLPPSGLRPLGLDLLCFAVMPALCEEVLFRGAILSILTGVPAALLPEREGLSARRRYSSLVLSSLLFGLFHLSLAKILPTALLGLGFGAAVLLSGSLWASIAMHATNNLLVILLVRVGLAEPSAATLHQEHPALLVLSVALAIGLGAAGYVLLTHSYRSQTPAPAPAVAQPAPLE